MTLLTRRPSGNSIVRRIISVSPDFWRRPLACRGCGRFTGGVAVVGVDDTAGCDLFAETGGTAGAGCLTSCLAADPENSALAAPPFLAPGGPHDCAQAPCWLATPLASDWDDDAGWFEPDATRSLLLIANGLVS